MNRRRALLRVAVGALLAAAGLAILADRPGLEAEYFALTDGWQGEPVCRRVRPPRLHGVDDVAPIFHWTGVFSVRWSGWLETGRSGPHRFTLLADDSAYLKIGDRVVAAGGVAVDGEPAVGVVELASGLHRIEIGLAQRAELAFLQVLVADPGEAAVELPAHRLWTSRPGPARRLVRRMAPARSPVGRRVVGAGLLLAGLLALARTARGDGRPVLPDRSPRRALRSARLRRVAAPALLIVLGAVAYSFTLRLAGSPLGFDDVRYMEAAVFTKGHGWMLDRFVHVYLLKAWQNLFAPDFFLAARHYWAALATVTTLSLAVAAFALGPGLQPLTLAVTLWLALAQTVFFETAGAMWTDYTTMAFITAAVAVLLHRLSLPAPPRWELHALAVGALTLGAMRSKATGAVLLWLVLAFLWENGRPDLGRAARKLAFWAAGLAAAQLFVMGLDARFLGDAFFSLRSHTYRAAGGVHLEYGEPEALLYGWIDQVWPRLERGEIETFEFFPLALLVAGALAAAVATRQKPERLVVHLLPFAFLGALLLLQVRGTYGALPRHLFPMVPVACLLGGSLFHYAGIDRLGWRELTAARVLAPLAATVLLVGLVFLPAANSALTVAEIAPLAAGPEAGHTSPEDFYRRAVIPAALALAALLAPAAIVRRGGRVALLLALCVVLLADGTADTLRLHSTRRPAQRGEMIVYPWAVFADEIQGARKVVVSPHLFTGGQRFFGPRLTAEWVARLYLRDLGLEVKVRRGLAAGTDVALGGAEDLERWDEGRPGLAATALSEPLGRIFLVRPGGAATAEPR